MDAIQMLIEDHKEAEELFLMYEGATDPSVKEAICHKLTKALSVHMEIEEELFYPEARDVLPDDDMVDEAEDEHDKAKKLVKKLEAGPEDHTMAQLKAAIEHHVEEEEGEMFPKLQKLGMETVELGARMKARKSELM